MLFASTDITPVSMTRVEALYSLMMSSRFPFRSRSRVQANPVASALSLTYWGWPFQQLSNSLMQPVFSLIAALHLQAHNELHMGSLSVYIL
jgi:hypothetical protein